MARFAKEQSKQDLGHDVRGSLTCPKTELAVHEQWLKELALVLD